MSDKELMLSYLNDAIDAIILIGRYNPEVKERAFYRIAWHRATEERKMAKKVSEETIYPTGRNTL